MGLKSFCIMGILVLINILHLPSSLIVYAGGPPPFVIACRGKNVGDSCDFITKQGVEMFGECQMSKIKTNILACAPTSSGQKPSSGNGKESPTSGRPGSTIDNKPDAGSGDSFTDTCDCKIARGILYTEPEDWESELSEVDLYYRDFKKKKPVVVFVHGGGWISGSKESLEKNPNIVNFFLDKGYVTASVNFRLVDPENPTKVRYSDMIGDIAGSIKWLSENAQNYGGLNDEFILVGYSSGAHLVSLISTDTRYLDKVGIPIENIRAVAAWDVPAYDVPLAIELLGDSSLGEMVKSNEALFGKTEEEQLQASPSHFVNNSKMPFFLASVGLKEGKTQTVTKQASEAFKEVLVDAGHKVMIVHYKDSDHADLVMEFGDRGNDLIKKMKIFLRTAVR